MASDVRLARLLRRADPAAILAAVAGDGLSVLDPEGMRLAGPQPGESAQRVPLAHPDGSPLGSVAGPHAERGAAVLAGLARLEQERRELAAEVLDLYREVNVLYTLGETLATAEDRADLARLLLREATRLVAADSAAVVVTAGSGTAAEMAAGPGDKLTPPADLTRLRIDTEEDTGVVLVAPLTFRGSHRGAVYLRRRDGVFVFTAADLKLMGAVAAAGVDVLERILEEELRAAAAAAREQQLRAQVEQLRIELDHQSQQRHVERITETDYFGNLRSQAEQLRRIIAEPPD